VFPLKHFVHALQDAFNPYLAGEAPHWDHYGVMLAWGVAAAVAALLLFRWESPRKGGATAPVSERETPRDPRRLRPVEEPGRPPGLALVANQAGYATRKLFRNTASVFFTIAFPVILLVLLPVVFGDGPLDYRGGIPLAQFLAPVLGVFGAAMAAYSDFSERVATDRDDGILKRLHGTPLPAWAYFTGRIAGAVAVAFLSLVVVLVAGVVVHHVEVVWRALPGLAVTVVVGTGCFAALGLGLATAAPDARSTSALAQATLLPLSFFSDVFLIGDLPTWMDTVGWVFPLKHFANAVADAFNPTVAGAGFFPDHLAVMAAWLLVGAAATLRWWTWEPRTSGRARRRGRRGRAATGATSSG
ncbi:MAG TPA: ABC transporter permease, partial [Egibacteraceae bacterium]